MVIEQEQGANINGTTEPYSHVFGVGVVDTVGWQHPLEQRTLTCGSQRRL